MIYIPITIRSKVASNLAERIVCNNSDDVIRFDFDEEWEAHPLNHATKKYIKNYCHILSRSCDIYM